MGLLKNRLTFLKKHSVFLFKNYFSEKNNYIALQVYQGEFSIKIKKYLKSAFSNKHLKLIRSDGHSYFSHSSPFLYWDSVGGYIKQFFFPIGKYLKENL